MKIVKPSVTLLWVTPNAEQMIEAAGRTAYKSEDKITDSSAPKFIRKLLEAKPVPHESVLEHACASVRIICDRGVSHEMVRHRLASYTQESTRYCDYAGEGIEVVDPCISFQPDSGLWEEACEASERMYRGLRHNSGSCLPGVPPQIARSVLPTCLKTELVMTTNFREWRHVLKLRTSKKAHPQMREIANMIWFLLKRQSPACFESRDFPNLVCPGLKTMPRPGPLTMCGEPSDCVDCCLGSQPPGTIICPDCELSVPVGSPCPHCTRQHFEPDGERAEDNRKDFDAMCDEAGL